MNTRPATSDDYEFVYQVKVDALKEYIAQTWGWDDRVQREFHERNFSPENMQIIRHDEADAGFLVVEEMKDEIRLNEINLLRRFQRKGIATEIIQKIQGDASAKERRVWLQVLKVNPAIRLYERLGFTVYAETETHDKMTYGESDAALNKVGSTLGNTREHSAL